MPYNTNRLLRFVEKTVGKLKTDCWEWKGTINKVHGYGYIMINRKMYRAHRLAYELFVGPIPEGLCVCHHCDNKACVNPNHLFIGTNQDNVDDKVQKGRQYKPKGEEHSQSKFNNEQIKEICKQVKMGETQAKVAERFNVHPSAISRIVNHKRWDHI